MSDIIQDDFGTRFRHNGDVVAAPPERSAAAAAAAAEVFERAALKRGGRLIKGAFHLWILECQRRGADLMPGRLTAAALMTPVYAGAAENKHGKKHGERERKRVHGENGQNPGEV